MGNADLRMWNGVVVNVSTYQMVVLLLFNSHSSLSLETIQTTTNIEDKELRRHLLSLLRAKLISKQPAEPKKKVEQGDVFQINTAFKTKVRLLDSLL
jgi:cullin 3